MSNAVFIDLSLSTDDEGGPVKLPTISKPTSSDAPSRPALLPAAKKAYNPHHFSSDDIIEAFISARPAKRQCLAPPPPTAPTAAPPRPAPSTSEEPSAPRPAQASKYTVEFDPILFTSSPHPPPTAAKPPPPPPPYVRARFEPLGGFSDDDLLDLSDEEQRAATSTGRLRESSGNARSAPTAGAADGGARPRKPCAAKSNASAEPCAAGPRRARATSAERELRLLGKERAREERERAKEEERQVKKAARECERAERALGKQRAADLAEANRARWDKKVSTGEMVVDLPLSLAGRSVDVQAREMLRKLGVETTGYAGGLLPDVVKWRRKARARFDEEAGHWEPMPETVLEEAHVLCLVEAVEFAAMAGAGEGEKGLDGHVERVRGKFRGAKVLYLIEGLELLLKRTKNKKNRAFQAAVRGQAGGRDGAKKGAKGEEVDAGKVEEALMRLQVEHECLIHHTATSYESAEWIVHFTQHISTVPYRAQRSNIEASFCMDVGQVRTGEDKEDTYVKMLQQVVRVTAPIAYGIAAKYHDVSSLTEGFERKGPLMLEDLKKCANNNGSFSDARIGPAVSKRLEKVFLGRDASSTDI